MDDFKLHHHVSELIKAFGVSDVLSDTFADYLQQNQTPYVTSRLPSHSPLERLASHAQDGNSVLRKYEELQARNFRELDSVVCFLDSVANDVQVKSFLATHSQHNLENEHLDEKDKLSILQHLKRNAAKKKTVPAGMCQFPKWVRDRPNFTWNFNCQPRLDNVKVGPIGVLPRETQESLLLNDIFYCMQGIDGDYITATDLTDTRDSRVFRIDESADPSILELSKRIIPLFVDYSTVISFIEERTHFEYGLVNHALCSAMREMLKDYYVLIPQLEQQKLQGNLTLQQLWFYIRPVMLKIKAIANIASAITKGDCFGGTVLSLLHKRATTLIGDKEAQDICYHFVQCASVPYFEILEKWIYRGIICDPYSEFLVEDNELAKKEEMPVEYSCNYWEKRYTVRRENVPIFLETSTDMILRTGKYLNVIRQCGHDIKFPNDVPLKYAVGERSFADNIGDAYQFASKKLLDLLMEENDLKSRLRSVKHYFLLDKGDFFVQFMDMAEEELLKDIDDVLPSRLEALLELALRSSIVNSDKYKDDVKIVFLTELLQSQLFTILNISTSEQKVGSVADTPTTGMEAFAFDYEVKWPLSLIINQKAITSYQILFRHLFSCRYVEGLLGRVWTSYKKTKTCPRSVSCSFASAFALCQQMLNFIQNLNCYFTMEVIEPHWQYFESKIQQVLNVDEVLQCHEKFLDDCIHDCMLVFPDLLQILAKLIKICILFCNYMQEMHKSLVEPKPVNTCNSLLAPLHEDVLWNGSGDMMSAKTVKAFKEKISHFHVEFNTLFVLLLKAITSVSSNKSCAKILDMLYRLDFVGFYTKTQKTVKNEDCVDET